ncbi:hypothetical protein [Cryobacterium sp. Y11]|uniref:hypothetical protein n=1 Tax=Cryobacterium sp. Y11 TaxID=2045016 RepID=UPI000CE3642C|nr:hypothetical protein [Cryobacterium sp. Y11]
MKRTVPRFLVFFTVMVAAALALILVLPASLGSDASIPAGVPIALGALFVVSSFLAWLVRPNWKQLAAQSPQ